MANGRCPFHLGRLAPATIVLSCHSISLDDESSITGLTTSGWVELFIDPDRKLLALL